jgi:hypothetical protein
MRVAVRRRRLVVATVVVIWLLVFGVRPSGTLLQAGPQHAPLEPGVLGNVGAVNKLLLGRAELVIQDAAQAGARSR